MTASNKKKIQVVRGGSKSLPSHSNGLLKDILPKELGGPDGASTAEEMAKDWKETVIQNSHKLKCLDYLKLQEDGTWSQYLIIAHLIISDVSGNSGAKLDHKDNTVAHLSKNLREDCDTMFILVSCTNYSATFVLL